MEKIKNDKDYFALLDRILDGAKYLSNPFITPKEYDKALPLYEKLCKRARKYRMKLE